MTKRKASIPSGISEEQLKRAKEGMSASVWIQRKSASRIAQTLEYFREEIEDGRKAGASWPVITETLNMHLGSRLHPTTVRTYFTKKAATAKESAQDATVPDLSGFNDEDQAAHEATLEDRGSISPVSGS